MCAIVALAGLIGFICVLLVRPIAEAETQTSAADTTRAQAAASRA
jgi:hypothetical protein